MAEEKPKGKDVAAIIGRNDDGSYEVVRHHEDHRISIGTVKPVKEGQSITGEHEVIKMSAVDENGLSDVESIYKPPNIRETTGPAQVSNNAYRTGWDSIFGSKTVGEA